MSVLSFFGCAVIVCVILVVLRQNSPEISVAAGIAAGVVLFAVLLPQLAPIFSQLTAIAADGALPADGLSVIIKALGISLAAQLASDVCRDAGQQTVASKVDTAGRVAILLVTMPLLSQVLSIAAGLIYG